MRQHKAGRGGEGEGHIHDFRVVHKCLDMLLEFLFPFQLMFKHNLPAAASINSEMHYATMPFEYKRLRFHYLV